MSDYRRAQPVFPLAEDDGDDEGRISPFPYSETEDVVLPEGYTPTKYDVINGRGRKSYNHIANRRFRQLIAMNLARYQDARCKVDKTLVVVGIVNSIRNASPCGGFIKKNKSEQWISMSDEGAREKVGHCLRDMLASKREGKKRGLKAGLVTNSSSSTAAKKKTGSSSASAGDSAAEQEIAAQTLSFGPAWGRAVGRFPSEIAAAAAAATAGSNHAAMLREAFWAAPPMSEVYHHPLQPMGVLSRLPIELAVAAAGHPLLPHHQHMPPMPMMSFSNLDSVSLQKGNLQDMSDQQRKILVKLESGFKGTVEELVEAVRLS